MELWLEAQVRDSLASRARGSALGVFVAVMLGAGLLAGDASLVHAHASLERADPEPGSQLAQPPSALTLYFTQRIVASESFVQLRDSAGVDISVSVTKEEKLMRVAVPTLAPGIYAVRWLTLSADDDDYLQETYNFTVLNPDGSEPDSAASVGEGDDDSSIPAILPQVIAALLILAFVGKFVLARRSR